MKTEKGFRIPEPSDRAIRWPGRGSNDEILAIFDWASTAWLVPGRDRAFGDALELVKFYGNDWFQVVITRVTEPNS